MLLDNNTKRVINLINNFDTLNNIEMNNRIIVQSRLNKY